MDPQHRIYNIHMYILTSSTDFTSSTESHMFTSSAEKGRKPKETKSKFTARHTYDTRISHTHARGKSERAKAGGSGKDQYLVHKKT